MSRTLSDDFDEDDSPGGGGSLDLEKGSQTGAGGIGGGSSNYDDGGGMEFDDDPYGEGTGGAALELDLPPGSATAMRSDAAAAPPPPPASPASPAPLAPAQSRAAPAPPKPLPSVVPSSQRALGTERAKERQSPTPAADDSGAHPAASSPAEPAAPARPTAAVVIAKYPPAPPQVWQAPKYFIQILLRQFELRSNLESLRRRRSPDVPLYESALRAYDAKTFRLGLALSVAILVLATFIVSLPVILRFVRAD